MSRPRIVPGGQSKAEIEFLSRPAKVLVLPDISFGRCDQTHGRLSFSPDGSGTWTCSTSNANPAHIAAWQTHFVLKNTHGETLFGVGPLVGPPMEPGDPFLKTSWSRAFEFPAAYFTEIASVTQNCGRTLTLVPKQKEIKPTLPKPSGSMAFKSVGWPWGQLYLHAR